MIRRLVESIFYGNYFYGVCAVALAIEATLQQRFPLNGFIFYFLLFISTVLYYSYPYIRKSSPSANPRTNWYTRNYHFMYWNQVLISIILAASLVSFLYNYWPEVMQMHWLNWLLVLIFPVVAALYYGLDSLLVKVSIRKIGWSKPFIIGFTWAGLVNIYPVLLQDIMNARPYEPTVVGCLLFIKNFMFISVLCIMFDIKDYSDDYLSRLRTFVVKIGLKRTIYYILIPLSLLGLGTFIYYGEMRHFSRMRIFLNVIPFVLLILAAWSLFKRRSILYYLVVIDGLMLIKAICGTIAILYF